MTTTTPSKRPLGVVHLVFGLVFTGIAAIWLIGEANDTATSDLAVGFPAVLIGAGIFGLAATLVNQRRAKAHLASARTEHDEHPADVTAAVEPSEPVDEPTDQDQNRAQNPNQTNEEL